MGKAAIAVLVVGCAYVAEELIDWLKTQYDEANTRAIGIQVTRESIAKAGIELTARAGNNNEVKILYRGTALKRALQPRDPLWLTDQVYYVTVYAHSDANAQKPIRDTSAIAVYATPLETFHTLIASGNIQVRMGIDYGFDITAQSFLIGPIVIPIPDYFIE